MPFDEKDWREALLGRLRFVLYGLLATAGLLVAALARTDQLRQLGVIVLAMSLALPLVLSRQRIPYVWRAWTSVVAFGLASCLAYLTVAYNPGSVLSACFCIVVAALLLGQRAMLGMLGVFIALPLAIALAIWAGV